MWNEHCSYKSSRIWLQTLPTKNKYVIQGPGENAGVVEFIAAATGVGIVALIGIRQFTRVFRKGRKSRFFGSGNKKAYYVEATILAVVFCVFSLRGLEGALAGVTSWNWHYAISYPAVLFFSSGF